MGDNLVEFLQIFWRRELVNGGKEERIPEPSYARHRIPEHAESIIGNIDLHGGRGDVTGAAPRLRHFSVVGVRTMRRDGAQLACPNPLSIPRSVPYFFWTPSINHVKPMRHAQDPRRRVGCTHKGFRLVGKESAAS